MFDLFSTEPRPQPFEAHFEAFQSLSGATGAPRWWPSSPWEGHNPGSACTHRPRQCHWNPAPCSQANRTTELKDIRSSASTGNLSREFRPCPSVTECWVRKSAQTFAKKLPKCSLHLPNRKLIQRPNVAISPKYVQASKGKELRATGKKSKQGSSSQENSWPLLAYCLSLGLFVLGFCSLGLISWRQIKSLTGATFKGLNKKYYEVYEQVTSSGVISEFRTSNINNNIERKTQEPNLVENGTTVKIKLIIDWRQTILLKPFFYLKEHLVIFKMY